MHDRLLEHQDKLRMADLVSYADRLGLDVARFTEDVRGRVAAKRIAQDGEGADRGRVSGSPRSSSTGTATTARTTWTLCRSPRRRRPRQAGGGVALTCLVGYRPSSRSGSARLAVGLGWSGPGGQAVPRRGRKICGNSRQGRGRRSPSTKKAGVAWTPALPPPAVAARR